MLSKCILFFSLFWCYKMANAVIRSNNRLPPKLQDPRVNDFTEEELGIFVDNTECADLTDSEDEDFARSKSITKTPEYSYDNSKPVADNLVTTTTNIIDVQIAPNKNEDLPQKHNVAITDIKAETR